MEVGSAGLESTTSKGSTFTGGAVGVDSTPSDQFPLLPSGCSCSMLWYPCNARSQSSSMKANGGGTRPGGAVPAAVAIQSIPLKNGSCFTSLLLRVPSLSRKSCVSRAQMNCPALALIPRGGTIHRVRICRLISFLSVSELHGERPVIISWASTPRAHQSVWRPPVPV